MPVPSFSCVRHLLAGAILPSLLLILIGGCDSADADSVTGGQSSGPPAASGQALSAASASLSGTHGGQSSSPTAASGQADRGGTGHADLDARGQSSSALATAESTLSASLPDPPRIAALAPFAVDLLLELGVTPVAAPRLDGGTPPRWGDVALVTVEHGAGPNAEELLAANPEIIVVSSDIAHAVTALAPVHRAEVVTMDVTSLDALAAHATTLATLAGRPDAAARVFDRLARDGAALTTDDPVDVLAIFGTAHSFFAFLPESYLGDLIDRSGGRLVTADLDSHPLFTGLAPLTMESIIARAPERIIVIFHGSSESVLATLQRDPAWNTLDAVRAGRVTTIPDDLVILSPGVNVPDALRLVRNALHAE